MSCQIFALTSLRDHQGYYEVQSPLSTRTALRTADRSVMSPSTPRSMALFISAGSDMNLKPEFVRAGDKREGNAMIAERIWAQPPANPPRGNPPRHSSSTAANAASPCGKACAEPRPQSLPDGLDAGAGKGGDADTVDHTARLQGADERRYGIVTLRVDVEAKLRPGEQRLAPASVSAAGHRRGPWPHPRNPSRQIVPEQSVTRSSSSS